LLIELNQHRRKGLGTALLCDLIRNNSFGSVKIVNTEKGCDSIDKFLISSGIPVSGSQYEMIKSL